MLAKRKGVIFNAGGLLEVSCRESHWKFDFIIIENGKSTIHGICSVYETKAFVIGET